MRVMLQSNGEHLKTLHKLSLRGRFDRGNLIEKARLLRFTRNDNEKEFIAL
mgnify:CR=1 FL=1